MRLLRVVFLVSGLLVAALGHAACTIDVRAEPIGRGVVSYETAGSGPPVLMLHGLFASKEQWNAMLCALADSGYRAVAPDLPGYGKSVGYGLSVYRLERQVELLHRLVGRLQMDRFDLAGSSMGGAIAALYRNRYPEQIRTVAFIGSPLGIVPWARGVREAIFAGINPFIPINSRQFDLEMGLLFVHPPVVPVAEKQTLIADYISRNRHYVQVWNIVNLYDGVLRRPLPGGIPSLILWGREDEIYSVSGASRLQRRIPGSVAHVLPAAGHLLLMENAEAASALYLEFLRLNGSAVP
jgi:pimeloyl-ACP methyl ester carboxylesterase